MRFSTNPHSSTGVMLGESPVSQFSQMENGRKDDLLWVILKMK